MTIRLRAAPAPSGELHVGNVRTFLFNWLYARHLNGVFVLRIEDTDKARFTEEAYLAALQDLRWLGLDWDEGPEVGGPYGPYRQSERIEMHREAGLGLLASGAAYECFCRKEELDERRKLAMAEGRTPGYDGRCYRLSDSEKEQLHAEGRPSAVRFRVPEGRTTFTDLVVGEVSVENETIDDFVIMRSDGSALYHLGVVVDDAHMKITHVVRGDDHLSNTPKQILLHRALGNPEPRFAHVPQVHGHDKKPLAKRHGSTAIGEFRNAGYLPDALFNHLALLGWGMADETIINRDLLVDRFDISDVHPSPAMFDFKKLDWMNGEYIRLLSDKEFASKLEPWLGREGLVGVPATEEQKELLARVAPLLKTRIKRLEEAPAYARPLFTEIEMEQAAFEKVMRHDHVKEQLERSVKALDVIAEWDAHAIEEALRGVQTEMELKPKTAFAPFYVAVTGGTVGAPVFDVMAILGREKTFARLQKAQAAL